MVLFPFYVDIENKNFLIIGAGHVASRKVNSLLQFTDRITVVAEDTGWMEEFASRVNMIIRPCAQGYADLLDQADYCIAATSDEEANAQIARLCGERKIPVNVVNNTALCTWEFPAMVHKGDLTVAVSTSGSSPAYARMLRQQIEAIVPDDIEQILERMQQIRGRLPDLVPEQKMRKTIYKKVLAKLIECDNEISDEQVKRFITELI